MLDLNVRSKILAAYQEAKAKAAEAGEKKPAPNRYDFPWSDTVLANDRKTHLRVAERADQPGVVRVRLPVQPNGNRPWLSVEGAEIRAADGKLAKRQCDLALSLAKDVYDQWKNPSSVPDTPAVFTLRDGLMYFLDEETGKPMDPHWRAQIGSFPIAAGSRTHIAVLDEVLGLDDVTFEEFSIEHARRIWKWYAKHGGGRGRVTAGKVIATVYAAAKHARAARKLAAGACVPPEGWRKTLDTEWATLTGASTKPRRPRYTKEESKKIISGLDRASERLRVALYLLVGYRVAQLAMRARWSNLSDEGEFGLRLRVLDQKTRKDVVIDVPVAVQVVLREAMQSGYLADLEAAREAGTITDYYLIPSGRLKRTRNGVRRASVASGARPMGKRQLMSDLRKLEKAVGVTYEKLRGFHGLRRAMEGFVSEETTDNKARDTAGGWSIGSGTRESNYTDDEDERTRSEAAKARSAAVAGLSRPSTPAARIRELAISVQRLGAVIADEGVRDAAVAAALQPALSAAQALEQALESASERLPDVTKRTDTLEAWRPETDREFDGLIERVRSKIADLGLTGREVAKAVGASKSDVSAVVRGKGRGIVSLPRLREWAVVLDGVADGALGPT
jgi:hypothetical protein